MEMDEMERVIKRLDALAAQVTTSEAVHREEHKHLSDVLERVETQTKKTNGQLIKAKEDIVQNSIDISGIRGRSAGIAATIASIGVLIAIVIAL